MEVGGTQPGFLPCAKFDYASIDGSIDIGFGAFLIICRLRCRRSSSWFNKRRGIFGIGFGRRAGSSFVRVGELSLLLVIRKRKD